MADNPFYPKYSLGLLGMLTTPPAQEPDNPLARALGLIPQKPALPVSPLGAAVSDLFPPTMPRTNPPNNLTGLASVDLFQPFGSLASPRLPVGPLKPAVKRKAFFSFHYDDIMRVNVVRNAWKIDHPDNALMRSFQDSSLWESRKLEGDQAVKRLIREGVEYTSAVCVLIGADTWWRRWVRYEIARAIIDGRGLLGVHLNNIRHHHTKTPHTRGYNPLEFLAVGKVQPSPLSPPRYYLFEKQAIPDGRGGQKWLRYADYTDPVRLPPWLADPAPDFVTPLSDYAHVYDYIADDGHRNIGSWIDKGAQGAGR